MHNTLRRCSLLASRSRAALVPRLAARTLCTPPAKQSLADKGLIHGVDELSNETLFLLSKTGDLTAARERMIREVMGIDGVDRDAAKEMTRTIAKKNAEGLFMGLLPYRVGISVAIASAWISIPAVFSLQFAKTFNTYFVTTEVPSKSELDTLLEVGSWTWNWMEPPLGTISFFLLCLQYARDQRINIGQKPWTDQYRSNQADKVALAFPLYDRHIVRDYAKVTVFEDDSDDF